jgi:hypothetical protein
MLLYASRSLEDNLFNTPLWYFWCKTPRHQNRGKSFQFKFLNNGNRNQLPGP